MSKKYEDVCQVHEGASWSSDTGSRSSIMYVSYFGMSQKDLTITFCRVNIQICFLIGLEFCMNVMLTPQEMMLDLIRL